jgi:tripartite-type tricarboxylate transporter receptor subunit TctC
MQIRERTKTSISLTRRGLAAAASLSLALTLAACGSHQEGAESGSSGFGSKGIRWIISSEAGGGADRSARQLQPGMEAALGTKIALEYQGGAGGAVAMQYLRPVTDCNTLVQNANPKVLLGQYVQKADYDYERDFVSVGGFTRDYAVLLGRAGSEWDSINKVVDYARQNPGKITVGVGTLASDGKAPNDFAKAAGVELNIVPLGGGSDAMNGLLGDKVQVAASSLFNSISLLGKVKVLAVLNDENPIPDKTGNAPTANAALNIKMTPQVNNYGLFVSKACKDNHPEQYKALVDALQSTLQDSDFKSAAQKLDQTGWYVFTPPEDFDKEIIAGGPDLLKYVQEENITGEN